MISPLFRTVNLIYFFCFSIFLSITVNGQTENEYQLLWKIEGPSSDAPSYLFGTMHIDDARVFNFSDAVLPAIESTKYFALEVNPDSLMVAFARQKYDVSANDYFKGLLSPEDYLRLSERFEEVNDISLEDSGIMSPQLVLTMLIPDFNKEDDKSTFVDMYLLGHARTMDKEIVGLENIDEQISFFDRQEDEKKIKEVRYNLNMSLDSIKQVKEIMTEIYATGNLNKIKEFVEQNYSDGIYSDMTSRNKQMASSIIKYMKTGSIFAGVGAAHLVGNDNVIELLQNEGYKVSAVDAEFTGVADTYKIDPSKGEWHSYIDNEMGYYVEIPARPNLEENSGKFTVHGYGDTSTNTNYLFMAIDLGYDLHEDDQDALLNKMIENINEKRSGEILDQKQIKYQNYAGYDVTGRLPGDILIKSKYIVKNNLFYYFSAETSADQIDEDYIKRYLNSIVINGVKKKSDDLGWREFKSEEGAFRIEIPVEPQDLSREYPNPINPDDDPYFLNLYLATNTKERNNYLFRYNDQPLGYYMNEPEAAFDEMKNTLTQKSTLLSEPKVIYLEDMEGREYELSLNDKYHSVARVYFRGNRTYLLLQQKLAVNEKISPDDPFFDSFKLLPYAKPELKDYTSSNESFKIKWFENTTESVDTTGYDKTQVEDSNDYTSVNPKSGGVYQYGYSNIKKYFRIKSYKAFLEEYKKADLEYNDSIVKERVFAVKGDSVVQFSVKNKNSFNVKSQTISRIWLNNNRIQIARAIVSDEEANSDLINEVFNSVRMSPPANDIDIFSSKAKLIIKDLKSKDSLTYQSALEAFNYYEFDKEELPLLHNVLKYKFPKERNELIKEALIDEFVYSEDPSSIKVMAEYYKEGDISDDLKSSILVAIPQLKSSDNLEFYNQLLFSDPPTNRDAYHYSLLSPFQDSLQYAVNNFDKLMGLIQYPQYRKDILNVVMDLCKSELEVEDLVKANENEIFKYLKNDYDTFILENEKDVEVDYIYESVLFAYLKLMNFYKSDNKSFDSISKELLQSESKRWMRLQALTARLFNGYKIPEQQFKELIEDYYFRFEIIEVYHRLNKLKDVDKRYLKPEEFAKLSLYNYADQDDEFPDQIDVFKKIEMDNKEFYVVKFSYNSEESDGDRNTYLGVVGPINTISQEKPIKMFDAISYWDTFDDNWKSNVDELISELLEYAD
ncbi:TraB/GumN family protein [Winogradskyella tangerina]|uniref:TraB/GumN family protein n=1 Tax=Winogradskyella tangerina TaxID=2023240 RepID=UPI000DBE437E|nr:TraB/GumN family protein [Winogradskyella tangerina]